MGQIIRLEFVEATEVSAVMQRVIKEGGRCKILRDARIALIFPERPQLKQTA